MRKIFTSIAISLDGYIASKSGDVSWLNDAMIQGEDYGFDETMKRTGIFIMGANTYKEMLKSAMAGGKERILFCKSCTLPLTSPNAFIFSCKSSFVAL